MDRSSAHSSMSPPTMRRSSSIAATVSSVAGTSSGRSVVRSAAPAVEPSDQAATMRQIYAPIASQLRRVDERLHRELQSRYECLMPVLRHGTQLGGKRLRPALLLLSGQAIAPDRAPDDDHIVMATVIEMVHTATLVHDDVLDKADTRRHVPTINARWDTDTSILLGDYLFAQSFELAATLPSTRACRWVGRAARGVCEGELRQVLSRDWLDIDQETYFDILRGKTAELTRVACQLGGDLSGASEAEIDALGQFGNDLGIAFQIADDLLDLWGDDEHVGKTLGTDIQQGKMTLPLIRICRGEDTELAKKAIEALRMPSDQRLNAVMPLLRQSDAAEFTARAAERYRDSAIEAISSLPESPATDSLRAIAHFSVQRRY